MPTEDETSTRDASAINPDDSTPRAGGPGGNVVPADPPDALAWLGGKVVLWHAADGAAYATICGNAKQQHVLLDSDVFKVWLQGAHYKARNRTLKDPRDVVELLKCRALYDSPSHDVATRTAMVNGKVYVDNVGPDGVCLEISPSTTSGVPWRIVDDPPVRFVRPAEQRPLPMPEDGGTLQDLRALVNCTDVGFHQIVGFMVASLMPELECPVLGISGPQGSGKTKLTAMIRDLVDPRDPCLSSLPLKPQDLGIMCNSALVVAFDNGSAISDRMSDAFCQVVSGTGAFENRKLYTNGELAVVKVRRARVILNGIPQLAERPDLADRVLHVRLTALTEEVRLTEDALRARFAEVKGRMFGVLLNGLASALGRSAVKPSRMPRMADWGLHVTRAEHGLGLPHDTIVGAFWSGRADAMDSVLEASVTATAILNLRDAYTKRDLQKWEGTLGQLLTTLRDHASDGGSTASRWPRSEKALAEALERETPVLSEVGVRVEPLGKRRVGNGGRNVYRITFRTTHAAEGTSTASDHMTIVPAAVSGESDRVLPPAANDNEGDTAEAPDTSRGSWRPTG